MFSLALNFIYRVIVFGLSRDKSLKTFWKTGRLWSNPVLYEHPLNTYGQFALSPGKENPKLKNLFTLNSPRVNTDTDLISMVPLLLCLYWQVLYFWYDKKHHLRAFGWDFNWSKMLLSGAFYQITDMCRCRMLIKEWNLKRVSYLSEGRHLRLLPVL